MSLTRSKLVLLGGASVLALLSVRPAEAQLASRFNAGIAPSGSALSGGGNTPTVRTLPADAQSALNRQLQSKARAATAVEIAQQAQAAARSSAVRNLVGPTPNGLGLGALNPAVLARTNATADASGILTWDGADLPTQTANAKGGYDVTVKQDQQRALLSWTTFNVGKDTSLTFDQKGNSDWVVLNRVVGQLDPLTGRRDPNLAPAPSQILGSVKADGTVLVINQNGIIFGPTAQINTHSLIATSLEIGVRGLSPTQAVSTQQRNQDFIDLGINGLNDRAAGANGGGGNAAATFSGQNIFITDAQGNPQSPFEPLIEGTVSVEAGAQITAGTNGLILLMSPNVDNAGTLSVSDGQVALAAGRQISVTRSTGAADSGDPNLRGIAVVPFQTTYRTSATSYVRNTGLIQSPRGNISLIADYGVLPGGIQTVGAIVNAGVLTSSTSVSHNGSIYLTGSDISLAPGSTIDIDADVGAETIPQDAQSVADFKQSVVRIGAGISRVDIGSNAIVRLPGGDLTIGGGGVDDPYNGQNPVGTSRLFIDSGALLDVGGEKDVAIPASRNEIKISPLKKNELADTPNYRSDFLNGATVYLDPRLSGVRSDGVAWIGSPLVEAGSYYAQVGVKADELLTKGGTITLGTQSWSGLTAPAQSPDLVIKPGATLDISGGWVHYDAGPIRTSRLVTADGRVVDISKADPNDNFIGFLGGSTFVSAKWGIVKYYQNSFSSGVTQAPDYIEGRDAGALQISSGAMGLDAALFAQAFAGDRQRNDAVVGTAKPSLAGDARYLQGAPSQLPTAGLLTIASVTGDQSNLDPDARGSIDVVAAADYVPLDGSARYDQQVSIGADGQVVLGTRGSDLLLGAGALQALTLSDALLSGSGLADVSLTGTSGAFTLANDARITLAPGGMFAVAASYGGITIDGSVTIPSGRISLVETIRSVALRQNEGNVLQTGSADYVPGDFDVRVNGTLSTRGLWVNDYGLTTQQQQGGAWLDGGSIAIFGAARLSDFYVDEPAGTRGIDTAVDLSGSILVNAGAVLDLTSGGRVRQDGSLDLSARGGDLTLTNETTYFPINGPNDVSYGSLSGFRVNGLSDPNSFLVHYLPINPGNINARVAIAADAIRATGFAGGGTFKLTTPEFAIGDIAQGQATTLDLGFFSRTGFADYDIVSYKTALLPNQFANNLGGTDVVLATQTVTIGAGQTLSLRQAMLPSVLTATQAGALQSLASGGDVTRVVSAGVPTDAWDQRAVNLSLGGLIELDVSKGGMIEGAAGAKLSAGKLLNQGTIILPGGTIHQQVDLPYFYANAVGVHDLGEVFGARDEDGLFSETAINALGIQGIVNGRTIPLNNSQLLNQGIPLYLTGTLDSDVGIDLAPGSITDLSGVSIIDPRANGLARGATVPIRTGRIIDGGTIEAAATIGTAGQIFTSIASTSFQAFSPRTAQTGGTIRIDDGAALDLSGTSDSYHQPQLGGTLTDGTGYAPGLVWSDGGQLTAPAGLVTSTKASIDAHGGLPAGTTIADLPGFAGALGGTLTVGDLVLSQHDGSVAPGAISADTIDAAGFHTLIALGSVQGSGDVDFTLDGGRGQFFLLSRPFSFGSTSSESSDVSYLTTIRSDGATLKLAADYIGIASGIFGQIFDPARGTVANGSVTLSANTIDITGGLLIDRSVGSASFVSAGDIRLTGLEPYQNTLNLQQSGLFTPVDPALTGAIAANGDLAFSAAQIYPTTGSKIAISTLGPDSTIRFGRTTAALPDAPYSAGGALSVYAANIVQDGVLRVPLGTLTLGGSTPYSVSNGFSSTVFAPATQSVEAGSGSVTSVSANGLSIPYGITTDGKEWYFAPTTNATLTAPPAGVLRFAADSVAVDKGATIDLSGGGDVTAYEFIPGTGGSYDELDRFNPDPFSGNDGLQFPDGRQVYAIVPGLSQQKAAVRDPINSADYSDLYQPSGVGKSVYLDGTAGLAAGWYTLLPARYATLPGGIRIVEITDATNVAAGTNQRLKDGTVLVSGTFGQGGGANAGRTLFSVQDQAALAKHTTIQITSGNSYFAALAAHAGQAAPPLPGDAGRLVLLAGSTLTIDGALNTAFAAGGRGAAVDIAGKSIAIVSDLTQNVGTDAALRVTSDSLTNLKATSLLIGGTRTDNADGTTNLTITAQTIDVANDAAHPLSAPEVLLAVDDLASGTKASSITLADGATILATGTANAGSGNYIVDARTQIIPVPGRSDPDIIVSTMSGEGVFLRIANGDERLIVRQHDATAPVRPAATLALGAASLTGQSVLVDSASATLIGADARIVAKNVAVGAGQITFTNDPGAVTSGLVVTGDLLATLGQAERLTLRSQNTIDFVSGTYDLGQVRLDSLGLRTLGGDVGLTTDTLELSNSYGTAASCTVSGALACGTGDLAIATGTLVVGPGTVGVYGFGGSVDAAATTAVYSRGVGRLDVGAAALTLTTPFIGDRAEPLVGDANAVLPALTLSTTGALRILRTGDGTAAATVDGLPGASITLSGGSVAISGTELRSTAGIVDIRSASGITLDDGASVLSPGYTKTFGDKVDPVDQDAPGGRITLLAANGNIDLGTGTTVSVGGTKGVGGTLELIAANGGVTFGGTIDGRAPDGGSSFTLDTASAYDLAAIGAAMNNVGFTHALDLRSRQGDLLLAAGQTLTADSVKLTADGGLLTIAGKIDTSGVEGGDVALFGRSGVTLASSGVVDASASGYAADDSRTAHGGDVTLGTDGTGALTIARGAVVDLSADRPGDRLVRLLRNDVVYYQYAAGDQGGTFTLRAPVIGEAAGGTVNVAVADGGSVRGASAIDLVGVHRWDLAQAATSGLYSGVTLNTTTGAVTLDVTAGLDTANPDGTTTSVAGLNLLGDYGDGTVAQFVQDFDVSASYAALGGLATRVEFQARPGVDLVNADAITLASNWNLGAGVVDVTGAIAAGVMTRVPTGGTVIAGQEGALLADFTHFTYRPGGSIANGAPVVALRAGGDLTVNGAISDGSFMFADGAYTDLGILPTYTSSSLTTPTFNFNNSGLSLATYIPAGGAYSAALNSPSSIALTNYNMDPFPTLDGGFVPQSASIALIAGAADGAVDPTRVAAATDADLVISAGAAGVARPLTLNPLFDASPRDRDPTTDLVGVDDLTERYEAINGKGAPLTIAYGGSASRFPQTVIAVRNFNTALTAKSDPVLNDLVTKYGRTNIKVTAAVTGTVSAPVEVITYFLKTYFLPGLRADLPGFFTTANLDTGIPAPGPSFAQNVVRTGTGTVTLAAPGNVSLYDPTKPAPTYTYQNQGTVTVPLGGARVYTTGVQTVFADRTLADPETKEPVTVTAPTLGSTPLNTDYLSGASHYYLAGGGDIAVDAGGDVLSRRGQGIRLDDKYLFGGVGQNTDLSIQLGFYRTFRVRGSIPADYDLIGTEYQSFEQGIAAFGGGNVSVDAGRDIVDLSAIAAGSAVTSTDGRTLITFGGGDLTADAGRDVLGGIYDIWSGNATVTAGGDIGAFGVVAPTNTGGGGPVRTVVNGFSARLFDADVAISAGGSLDIQSISSIARNRGLTGIVNTPSGAANEAGLLTELSEVHLAADGDITLAATAAVLPSTFIATALTGDLDLLGTISNFYSNTAVLIPGALGQLQLLAGGNIGPAVIAMLDADPGQTPGVFSSFSSQGEAQFTTGQAFSFPIVLPNTPDVVRANQHKAVATHIDDEQPVRVYAGRDIGTANLGLTLWLPKQGRIEAGRDLLNAVLIGQNLHATDVTRVTAGRDIIGTSRLILGNKLGPIASAPYIGPVADGVPRAATQGNVFILGGPGSLSLEAGRDAGPFLTSATGFVTFNASSNGDLSSSGTTLTFGGGVLSVGNEYNPNLGDAGADVTVMFGVAGGVNYDGLRDAYLDPANLPNLDGDLFVQIPFTETDGTITITGSRPDRTRPIYAPILIAWLKAHAAPELSAAVGTGEPSFDQAYAVFEALPELRQRDLLNSVYFNELKQAAIPDSPSYQQYARGYNAVNVLFPASAGYTKNEQDGGSNGANSPVVTGNLDLRLATIQTSRGGNVTILGPGGSVLGGSTVRTSAQAALRNSAAGPILTGYYTGDITNNGFTLSPGYGGVSAIPSGYEGVLTLRGGSISTFTDGSFLLNQSRLFTRQGGDIIMWSSNADLNAGQGPKTSSNFPPVVVRVDSDLFSEEDRVASTTGAGIAAFRPTVDAAVPDVYLLAPRGTVDAGDAGVRVAGNLYVGALRVANADNFQVEGKAFGIPTPPVVDVAGNLSASNTAAASALEATSALARAQQRRTLNITVTVEGFGDDVCTDQREKCPKP